MEVWRGRSGVGFDCQEGLDFAAAVGLECNALTEGEVAASKSDLGCEGPTSAMSHVLDVESLLDAPGPGPTPATREASATFASSRASACRWCGPIAPSRCYCHFPGS